MRLMLRIRLLGTEVLAVEVGTPGTPPPAKEEEEPKGIHGGTMNATAERAWSPQHRAVGFSAEVT